MQRILAVTYSQAGQTARAADALLAGLSAAADVEITRLALDPEAPRGLPWRFFDFVRALPEAVRPAAPGGAARVDPAALASADTVVLAYPVWFLSPATPVAGFLRTLPDGALAGKQVITVATCRNMWVEAQKVVRRLVEARGGRVVAHAALVDRAPTYASLVTTPRFFLTGKRTFESRAMRRLFPEFGIRDAEYARLAAWARTLPADPDGPPRTHFELDTSMALAEAVGRRIFRLLTLPWPLVRPRPRPAQNLYLTLVVAAMVVAILALLPPLAVLGGLPPMRRRAARWSERLTSRRGATDPDRLSTGSREEGAHVSRA